MRVKCEDDPEGWLKEERAPRAVSTELASEKFWEDSSSLGTKGPWVGLGGAGENPQFQVAEVQTGARQDWRRSSHRDVCA